MWDYMFLTHFDWLTQSSNKIIYLLSLTYPLKSVMLTSNSISYLSLNKGFPLGFIIYINGGKIYHFKSNSTDVHFNDKSMKEIHLHLIFNTN